MDRDRNKKDQSYDFQSCSRWRSSSQSTSPPSAAAYLGNQAMQTESMQALARQIMANVEANRKSHQRKSHSHRSHHHHEHSSRKRIPKQPTLQAISPKTPTNPARHPHKHHKRSFGKDQHKQQPAGKPDSGKSGQKKSQSGPMSPADLDIDPKTAAVFDRKNYRVIVRLNNGAFSQVYRGEYVIDHRPVAVKVMDFNKLSQMFRVKYILRELQALIRCRHENIVQIYDIIRSNNRIFIFMEFCSKGDLSSLVKTHGPFNEILSRFWFQQLL